MRDIKFRAKCGWHGDEWSYGNLVVTDSPTKVPYDEFYILPKWFVCEDDLEPIERAETIGQYTGLKDREGREIYEDDILDFELLHGKKSRGCVEYSNEGARYVVRYQREKYERALSFVCSALSFVCSLGKPVVIGNTYENPELLEQERPNA